MVGRRALLLAGAAFPASAYGQCVINAPAVDACLGGVRNAGPAGATLDLNFMFPGSMPPGVTFTRASAATYTDASGVIQTAAVNQPRWDYAGGSLRGLLIEDARTNLCLWGADVSHAPWTPSGVGIAAPTVTANQVTAPDGTLTAARIVQGAVSGAGTASVVNQGIILPAAVIYAFSVWLRGAVGGEQTYIGVAGAGFGSAPRITLTTQWQRFVYITPALTAANWFWQIGTDLRDGSQTSTPAQTIYAWGGQVEQASFQSSYIITTASSATRAVDFARIPTNASWYGATLGTFSAEFILNGKETAAFPRILGNDAAGQGFLYVDSTFHLGAFDGGTISATTNVLTTGAVSKGVSVTPTGVGTASYVLNGGPVASHAMTSGMGASLTIRLMGDSSPVDTAHGYIRRVQYWPRALSTSEMQAVTT